MVQKPVLPKRVLGMGMFRNGWIGLAPECMVSDAVLFPSPCLHAL